MFHKSFCLPESIMAFHREEKARRKEKASPVFQQERSGACFWLAKLNAFFLLASSLKTLIHWAQKPSCNLRWRHLTCSPQTPLGLPRGTPAHAAPCPVFAESTSTHAKPEAPQHWGSARPLLAKRICLSLLCILFWCLFKTAWCKLWILPFHSKLSPLITWSV